MRNFYILSILLSLFYCRVEQALGEDLPKAIQPTFSIDGKNIQKFTIETDLPFFGKGKLLSYIKKNKDSVNQLEFYLIRDFDVLYKLPSYNEPKNIQNFKEAGCLTSPENKIEINEIKLFSILQERNLIIILYECRTIDKLPNDVIYIRDKYVQSFREFKNPIRTYIRSAYRPTISNTYEM